MSSKFAKYFRLIGSFMVFVIPYSILFHFFWEWYSSPHGPYKNLEGESLLLDFCIISAAPIIFIAAIFRRNKACLIIMFFIAIISIPLNLLMSAIYAQIIWKISN
jgi:hypothetical protein